MKVAILGSEGQIGQYLARYLEERGHEVWRRDISLNTYHDLRKSDNATLWEAVDKTDFVYFLAFDVGGSVYLASRQYTYEFLDNNTQIMHNVFRVLRDTQTPFIFTSSQMSNMLTSPYGMLKNIGEHYTRSLGGTNVRLWNVYGKENDPNKFHVITDFINKAKAGRIEMRTTGHEIRQFLHAEDCARALDTLSRVDTDPDKFYDITSFSWTSIYEVACLISTMVEPQPLVVRGHERDMTQTIRNEPTDSIMPFWHPKIHLEEGIRGLIEEDKYAA